MKNMKLYEQSYHFLITKKKISSKSGIYKYIYKETTTKEKGDMNQNLLKHKKQNKEKKARK
jgi:predicted transcriptional regulator